MTVVFGRLADQLGHSSAAGRFAASPAAAYLHEQNPKIPIDRDHDHRWVGEIVFLGRDRFNLWAVGEVQEDVAEAVRVRVGERTVEVATPLYWSASRIGGPDDGLVLDSVSLTASPASVDPRPVTFLQGALDHRQAAQRWRSRLDRAQFALLDAAANARADRQKGAPIAIHELTPPSDAMTKLRGGVWINRHGEPLGSISRRSAADDYGHEPGRPPGKLRMRPCTILSVR